jgi:hypothetical protein
MDFPDTDGVPRIRPEQAIRGDVCRCLDDCRIGWMAHPWHATQPKKQSSLETARTPVPECRSRPREDPPTATALDSESDACSDVCRSVHDAGRAHRVE